MHAIFPRVVIATLSLVIVMVHNNYYRDKDDRSNLVVLCVNFLKKNLSIPQSGGKMSKRLVGGIIGCKYKTSSWHLNGFPDDGSNIGSTV